MTEIEQRDVIPQCLRVTGDPAQWPDIDAAIPVAMSQRLIAHGGRRFVPDDNGNPESVVELVGPDGVAKSGAKAGGWLVICDGAMVGMSNALFANRFVSPLADAIEWAATDEQKSPPIAVLAPDWGVMVTFVQPTSANRPFTYTVTRSDDGTEVDVKSVTTVPVSQGDPATEWRTELWLDVPPLAEGETTGPFVVHVAGRFDATADSFPSNPVTRPAPEAVPELAQFAVLAPGGTPFE